MLTKITSLNWICLVLQGLLLINCTNQTQNKHKNKLENLVRIKLCMDENYDYHFHQSAELFELSTHQIIEADCYSMPRNKIYYEYLVNPDQKYRIRFTSTSGFKQEFEIDPKHSLNYEFKNKYHHHQVDHISLKDLKQAKTIELNARFEIKGASFMEHTRIIKQNSIYRVDLNSVLSGKHESHFTSEKILTALMDLEQKKVDPNLIAYTTIDVFFDNNFFQFTCSTRDYDYFRIRYQAKN